MSRIASNTKHQARRVVGLTRRTRQKIKNRLSVQREFEFNIDNPRRSMINKRTVEVEGWIFSKSNKTFDLRIRNNDQTFALETGVKRLDVAKTHPNLEKSKVLYSGFRKEIEFEDGTLAIEVNLGKGYRKLFTTEIAYGTGELPKDVYNKDLSNNYPEHLNLTANRKQYYYEESLADDRQYVRHEDDPRLVAIYLPQFHPFELNDKTWGKGFTEWTNVAAASPRFIGHQQPVLPSDLGFYDLRLEEKLKEQIDLAKKYGVYGFSFYYYWFSGEKIMDNPLETFMRHKEWDFNFSICWANENWTKRWDGRDNDVIIAQKYEDDDPIKFIQEVEDILNDPRYITEDGKPVLSVYRASELKDPARYAKIWREYFRKKFGKELQLVSYVSFEDTDPREYGFDAALDFAPLSAFFKNKLFQNNQFPYIDVSKKLLDINFNGIVADYRTIALNEKLDSAFDFPIYPCVTPSWDNDARKKGKGFVYQNSNPDIYANWLNRVVVKEVSQKKQPLIFVNAWNEWAEGAMLEPSTHLGHAVLKRTGEVIARNSRNLNNAKTIPSYGIDNSKSKKLAVIVHLYYEDLWEQMAERLSLIDEPFDVFVSLGNHNSDFKPVMNKKDVKVHTFVLPNRGRDVLPFIYMLKRINAAGYEYILKLHSKKSKWRNDGSDWFNDVLSGLLPSSEDVSEVVQLLKQSETGVLGPMNHLVSLKRHMGSNGEILKHLIGRAHGQDDARAVMANSDKYPYVGGTMFWARVDALEGLMSLELMPDDFPSEQGQIDGTLAHAIERFLGVSPKIKLRKMYLIEAGSIREVESKSYVAKYEHAP